MEEMFNMTIPWCLLFLTVPVIYYILLTLLRQFRVGYYDNRYIFITGCDTGFGYMLARRLDKLGCHVIAGCLTEDGFKSLKKECSNRLQTLTVDVTKEASIVRAKQIVERCLPRDKGLWAVVNNAGVPGTVAPLEWTPIEEFNLVMSVNLTGVVMVTKAFLPLVRKESGRVVNMASMCGRLAIATAAYNASKFAVEGFSDSIRRELYTTGVSVHIIEPGFFSTGIVSEETIQAGLERNFQQSSPEVRQYYGEAYKDTYIEKSVKLLDLVMSPRVNQVIDAYEHAITARFPKARYVVGWDANTVFRLLWNIPEWASDFLISRITPVPAGRTKHVKHQ